MAPEVTTDDLVKDLIAKELTQRLVCATDPSEAWEAWVDFVQKGRVLDSTVASCQANGLLARS